MACFKKYGYGHGNVFCTPECFRAHWDTHKYEGQPPFQSPARPTGSKVFTIEHTHSNGSFGSTDSGLLTTQGGTDGVRRAQTQHSTYKTPPRGRVPVQGS